MKFGSNLNRQKTYVISCNKGTGLRRRVKASSNAEARKEAVAWFGGTRAKTMSVICID